MTATAASNRCFDSDYFLTCWKFSFTGAPWRVNGTVTTKRLCGRPATMATYQRQTFVHYICKYPLVYEIARSWCVQVQAMIENGVGPNISDPKASGIPIFVHRRLVCSCPPPFSESLNCAQSFNGRMYRISIVYVTSNQQINGKTWLNITCIT